MRDVYVCVCATEMTKNFSGAEIEGLIRNTWSFALDRQVDRSNLSMPIDEDNLKVRLLFCLFNANTAAAFGFASLLCEALPPIALVCAFWQYLQMQRGS